MGYLTLDEIPSGRLCRPLFIPDDSGWLALFGGALTELTKTWNYQQFGTLTPEEMAQECQLIIEQWYEDICSSCELPDGERIVRISPNNVWQELVNGEWQETTGAYYIPPPEARTEPTTEERLCLAAKNAENVLKLMYEELTDLFGEALGTVEALAEWVGYIGAFVWPGLGLAMKALLTIGIIAFKEVFDFTEFITADFWTTTFSDNMICTLLNCASDDAGVVTFDFDCVWNRVKGQIEWLDPTISSAALAGQVLFMLNSMGAQGLNLAGATTAISDSDCTQCEDEGCYEWDFELSSGGWFPRDPEEANYIPSAGWASNCVAGTAERAVIQFNVPSPTTVNITRMVAFVEYVQGTWSGGGDSRGIIVRSFTGANGTGSVLDTGNAGSVPIPSGNYEVEWTEPGGAQPYSLEVNSWASNGACNGNVLIKKVRVYYFGADVFGAPNCPPE